MTALPLRFSILTLRTALLLTAASGLLAAGCQQAAGELPVATAVADSPATLQAADNEKVPPAPVDEGPLAIRWEELEVGIPPDSVFQPWMMKTSIKSLEGKTVRITGFMHGGVAVRSGIREFVMLRNLDCPYGRQGEAHHVLLVDLQGKLRTTFTQKPIALEGTFRIDPYNGPDGNTWALYRLEGTKIEPAATNANHTDSPENKSAIHPASEQVSP